MRVTAVSKDQLMLDGLDSLLLRNGVLGFAGSSDSVTHALDLIGHTGGVMVITDDMPKPQLELLRKVKESLGISVVLITSRTSTPNRALADRVVLRSAGASAMLAAVSDLLTPTPRGVAEAIQSRYGGKRLSSRELQVAELVARGYGNRRIAETLDIREQSVKNLVSGILTKLGCDNRTQVALALLGQGRPE